MEDSVLTFTLCVSAAFGLRLQHSLEAAPLLLPPLSSALFCFTGRAREIDRFALGMPSVFVIAG